MRFMSHQHYIISVNKIMKYRSLPKVQDFKPHLIEKEVGEPGWSNFLHPIDEQMPQHSFQCQCEMCKLFAFKKFKEAMRVQAESITHKIQARVSTANSLRQQIKQNNLQWVLKHLMVPTHKIATSSLNIQIVQTLFFKEGQATQLYLCKQINDPTIKKIGKEKLTNAYIQKIMSDRRRKYRDFLRIRTGKKKVQPKMKLMFGEKEVKKEIKDAVVIRYTDGYEQLFSQNDFLSMFLRRKQDPIWRQITSIRNFMNITNPEQKKSCYYVVKYRKGKIKYEQLFERAKTLIKVYGQYIGPQQSSYISPSCQQEFSRQLQSSSLQLYSEYLTYQIVNYIEYFYDEQITNIVIGLFYDEVGNVFLNEVYKLEAKSLIKFQWTNDTYKQRMDDEETKILETKIMCEIKKAQKGATIIADQMHDAYEHLRNKYGLNAENQDNQEEVANNNFFKILYPDFKHNITDVLKDPKLSLSEFKKKFLGQKKQKKPIMGQFTSNMIKTIHLRSPRLRRSIPHQLIQTTRKLNQSTLEGPSKQIMATPQKHQRSHRIRSMYSTLPLSSPVS